MKDSFINLFKKIFISIYYILGTGEIKGTFLHLQPAAENTLRKPQISYILLKQTDTLEAPQGRILTTCLLSPQHNAFYTAGTSEKVSELKRKVEANIRNRPLRTYTEITPL